jgi:translation initiation factor IF-3
VPVPRRFDRRPPERDTTRINERIRVPEVRLIDDEGTQVGVLKTADALAFAQERELDLVEVAPEARPPVCRVLDYSKYKYEQAQKLKQARKHQQQITIREIKFRPKIAEHDYDTKKHHVERFLRHKDKVKVTIMFRGREVTHPERGTAILDRLAEELSELGVVEQRPMQEGRNMTMMMAPSKAVLAGRLDVGEDAAGVSTGETSHDGDVASAALESAAAPARAPATEQASSAAESTEPAEATDAPGAENAAAETPSDAPQAEGQPAETPAEAPQAEGQPAETPAEAPQAEGEPPETPAAGDVEGSAADTSAASEAKGDGSDAPAAPAAGGTAKRRSTATESAA